MDDFKYIIDKLDAELNEIKLQDVGKKVSSFLSKVPQAIRNVYQKMARFVKKIEASLFRFGAAICQLKNNKFALFNSKGEEITPPLDSMKRVKFGKKFVPQYIERGAKLKNMQGYLQPDGRVAAAKGKSKEGIPVYYFGPSVFNPNLVQVESIHISAAEKIILENFILEAMSDKERAEQYKNVKKQAFIDFDDQALVKGLIQTKPRDIAESVIVASDLVEILEDMAAAVEAGGIEGRKISAFVYGPPGVGKSEIITNFFKKRGYKITLLQIQHVPIETLAGYPVIKTDAKMKGGDQVKMVVADILPPSDDKGKHLLFLDEFNAGTEEQMKAAMNLALTGNIGTYHLPPNTVIVAAGNAPEEDNATAVNTLDAPTLRRFVYKVKLKPDLPEWLKNYASKDVIVDWKGKKINTGPILSIITTNLVHWSEEAKDPEAAFRKVMQGFGGEEETGWLDPATWSVLDKTIKIRGLREYDKLDEETKKKLQKMGKERYKNLDEYSAGARLYINGMQDELLKRVGPRVLGKNSEELVSEMILNYETIKREKVSPIDVLLNYKEVRDRVLKSTSIDAEVLLREIAEEIINFGSISSMKQYMKSKNIPYYKSTKGDPLAQAFVNVAKFIEDKDVGSEIITAHFEALAPALEKKNKLALEWKAGLLQLGIDRIKEGWEAFSKTIDQQFQELADEKDKAKFMELKRNHEGYVPNIVKAAQRIKDPDLRQDFIDTENKRFILYFDHKKEKKQEESIALNVDSVLLEEMLKLAGVR